MNNFQALNELFRQIVNEELTKDERIGLLEKDGNVLFKHPENGQLIAMLTGKVENDTLYRQMKLENLDMALKVRYFDINMMVPYLKQGVKLAVADFRRILDDPKQVNEALERRKQWITA